MNKTVQVHLIPKHYDNLTNKVGDIIKVGDHYTIAGREDLGNEAFSLVLTADDEIKLSTDDKISVPLLFSWSDDKKEVFNANWWQNGYYQDYASGRSWQDNRCKQIVAATDIASVPSITAGDIEWLIESGVPSELEIEWEPGLQSPRLKIGDFVMFAMAAIETKLKQQAARLSRDKQLFPTFKAGYDRCKEEMFVETEIFFEWIGQNKAQFDKQNNLWYKPEMLTDNFGSLFHTTAELYEIFKKDIAFRKELNSHK